ncbi:hypothetical protein LK08_12215 [Streptomyces sp. MUSC 125]|uniref:hypothetical protein n=1 Tax=Streptomyces sp. MUSC 125 TaxID=1428624 RepID=UPI00057E1B2E|nr:hypothetical protein [Streptomyces sp. MUSC 125]KIE26691.1 hypothetical protein LK08_12215 [Streptomyces sp. MUSC 125]
MTPPPTDGQGDARGCRTGFAGGGGTPTASGADPAVATADAFTAAAGTPAELDFTAPLSGRKGRPGGGW